jgi:4-diphosphocytidyl-2-C-methyl-D-erythritol kinase
LNRLAVPAFAKINLGLKVVGRRRDGFHELRTVFQTISLHDTLFFEPMTRGWGFDPGHPEVPSGKANLVVRAALAFARAARVPLRWRIRLKKRIPPGSGLGGGSADAAVTLVALNRLSGRPLDRDSLTTLASSLGSDVPFFLTGGTALGLGRGEIVRPLRDVETGPVLLLYPGFAISTAEAFRRVEKTLTPARGQIRIYRFSQQRVTQIARFADAPNDLQTAVAPIHPRLDRLIAELRSRGATVASMTGSGSAVFGLFAGERKATRAFRELTGSSRAARAWLGRVVGAAEYAARVVW